MLKDGNRQYTMKGYAYAGEVGPDACEMLLVAYRLADELVGSDCDNDVFPHDWPRMCSPCCPSTDCDSGACCLGV